MVGLFHGNFQRFPFFFSSHVDPSTWTSRNRRSVSPRYPRTIQSTTARLLKVFLKASLYLFLSIVSQLEEGEKYEIQSVEAECKEHVGTPLDGPEPQSTVASISFEPIWVHGNSKIEKSLGGIRTIAILFPSNSLNCQLLIATKYITFYEAKPWHQSLGSKYNLVDFVGRLQVDKSQVSLP